MRKKLLIITDNLPNQINREGVYKTSKIWTWEESTKQFIEALK